MYGLFAANGLKDSRFFENHHRRKLQLSSNTSKALKLLTAFDANFHLKKAGKNIKRNFKSFEACKNFNKKVGEQFYPS